MSKENMSDHKMEYYLVNAKLCRLVQANPCMYDRSSPNYLRKECVERAWANIAKEVNDSVGSCKERWRNIRTAFARSVNIYKTPAGPNRHKRYYLHDELQFLTKHIAPGLPSLPIRILTPTELEENNDNSRQSAYDPDDSCTFQITIDSSSPTHPVLVEEEQVQTPEPDYNELNSSPPTKKRKPAESMDYLNDLIPKRSNPDPDANFLTSLLPEMKSMNARQKIVFKGKIFRALEEVFEDSKDFPNHFQPQVPVIPNSTPGTNTTANRNIGVGLTNGVTLTSRAAQTTAEQTDANPSTVPYNLNVPMVSLGQNEIYIKRETINVDVQN